MKSKNSSASAASALKMIPAKWALAIVVALIAYVLLQPKLNQWFGWSLPSLSQLSEDDGKQKSTTRDKNVSENDKAVEKLNDRDAASDTQPTPIQPGASKKSPPRDESDKAGRSGSQTQETAKPKPQPEKPKPTVEPKSQKTFLKEIGRDRFESPAGLVYGPGSEEGHRLKHVERHTKDIPDRPGSHGVFDGTMDEFLATIDDAVSRAKKGEKGTSKKDDDGAVVYEASFSKSIGYLGGQEGKRRKNPKLKKIRVVVRGNSVITAFPF